MSLVWFGLLGFNASATARVISRRWNDDDDGDDDGDDDDDDEISFMSVFRKDNPILTLLIAIFVKWRSIINLFGGQLPF